MVRRLLAALAGNPPSDRCRRCPVESALRQRDLRRLLDDAWAMGVAHGLKEAQKGRESQ